MRREREVWEVPRRTLNPTVYFGGRSRGSVGKEETFVNADGAAQLCTVFCFGNTPKAARGALREGSMCPEQLTNTAAAATSGPPRRPPGAVLGGRAQAKSDVARQAQCVQLF